VVDVLLVEDNPDLRAVFGRMLSRLGLPYRTATDVTSALANLTEQPPAVLLLDVGLGQQCGYDVLAQLRRDVGGHTQVLIVSGEAPPTSWPADVAPDGYLRKPVDMRDLAAAVRKHLRIYRERTVAN
jgi:two-component system response regulator RstA